MRVKLSQFDLNKLFGAIVEQKIKWSDLAKSLEVSDRNLRDWRVGKITIPIAAYNKCLTIAKINPNILKPEELEDFWHINSAAKKGGLARMKLYGNLGTSEGRKRGGLNSIKGHQQINTGFKILKKIRRVSPSEDLAELIGMLFGDGHLSDYQVILTTNSETDREHAIFFKSFVNKIFGLSAALLYRTDHLVVNAVVSSKNLADFLNSLGMPKGNKIKNNLAVPGWVMKNALYQKAFLRGLFDTDGCIYLDKHNIRDKLYKHMGWTITSYADKLVEGIIEILKNLGFNPTYRVSQRSVFLRRQPEIVRYFKEVGTHNPKHRNRYLKFSGEVPKWS